MKTILCYGDSNTWGWDPLTLDRLDRDTRWPGVLGNALGDGYVILEEGLSGRTTIWNDPLEGLMSGRAFLRPCLRSHMPLDLIIIMLGTNDLKDRFNASAEDIAAGMSELVTIALTSGTGPGGQGPAVLVVAPPPLSEAIIGNEVFAGGFEKSRLLGELYRTVAEQAGCRFLDAADIIKSNDMDGVHLDAEAHIQLGRSVAETVREIL